MRFSRKENSIETVIYKSFPHHPKSYTTLPSKKISLLISIVSWIKPGPTTLPDLANKHPGEGLPFQGHLSFMPFCFQDRFTRLPLLSWQSSLSSMINQCFHCQIDLDDIACMEKGEKNFQTLNFISLSPYFFKFCICRYCSSNSLSIYLRSLKENDQILNPRAYTWQKKKTHECWHSFVI